MLLNILGRIARPDHQKLSHPAASAETEVIFILAPVYSFWKIEPKSKWPDEIPKSYSFRQTL